LADPVKVVIALGSNLGDRAAHLAWAADALSHHLQPLQMSPAAEYPAVGVPDDQPAYLNAVAVGETRRSARDLLTVLLNLERQRGRTRDTPLAARTLDLDLIVYGNSVIREPGLVIPHPRFRERRFVLEPLVEVEPDLVDPVTGRTARELLEQLDKGLSEP
jgi:2-amino-4-hydroxy-6-hydroxymethyldihydropteridine diphosphokinase